MALDTVHATWPEKPVIVSEFGFAPNWQTVEGPQVVDPEHYYFAPEDQAGSVEAGDALRQALIVEQMGVFRTRSFVAGAIFWDYAGNMGVVDEGRRRRGSWCVLREEYSPVQVESLKFAAASSINRCADITLRTRGPLESDMPAYTLRGYRLSWMAASADQKVVFSQGEIALPELTPASTWSGELAWTDPTGIAVLTVSVIRPVGFAVLELSFDSQGNLLR
jgi:hypothetical protein